MRPVEVDPLHCGAVEVAPVPLHAAVVPGRRSQRGGEEVNVVVVIGAKNLGAVMAEDGGGEVGVKSVGLFQLFGTELAHWLLKSVLYEQSRRRYYGYVYSST